MHGTQKSSERCAVHFLGVSVLFGSEGLGVNFFSIARFAREQAAIASCLATRISRWDPPPSPEGPDRLVGGRLGWKMAGGWGWRAEGCWGHLKVNQRTCKRKCSCRTQFRTPWVEPMLWRPFTLPILNVQKSTAMLAHATKILPGRTFGCAADARAAWCSHHCADCRRVSQCAQRRDS